MVAMSMNTPLPGSLVFRPVRLPQRVERRRTQVTDLTLYNEKGREVGRIRAVEGSPEFGPDAPELFLDREV